MASCASAPTGVGGDVYETIEDEAELDEVFEEYLKIAEADEEE
jgi:hypothetical protein